MTRLTRKEKDFILDALVTYLESISDEDEEYDEADRVIREIARKLTS